MRLPWRSPPVTRFLPRNQSTKQVPWLPHRNPNLSKTRIFYNDVIKRKHFPRYWRFVTGIHWSPVGSPHKGKCRGALMLSLVCAWISGWANNRDVGDLRRHHAHYDVTVVFLTILWHGNAFGITGPLWIRRVPVTKSPQCRTLLISLPDEAVQSTVTSYAMTSMWRLCNVQWPLFPRKLEINQQHPY